MDKKHMDSHAKEFNFNEWMQLAQDDPDAFEQRREAAINSLINNASSQSRKRLEGMQWQIDQVRAKSKTPLAACLQLSKMMWDKVQGENGLVDHLNQLTGEVPYQQAAVKSAEILSFQEKPSSNV